MGVKDREVGGNLNKRGLNDYMKNVKSLCNVIGKIAIFFFQAEDGIRDSPVTEVQTLLFRSQMTEEVHVQNLRPLTNFPCRDPSGQ